jgi:excisionase family DNA binding protein
VPLDDLIESQKSALTVTEVAEMLHVSRRLIYQLVTIGEIPHFKVGSAVRFEPHRLAEWLRAKLKTSGKQAAYDRMLDHSQTGAPFKLGVAWELIWRDALLPDDRKSRW